MTWPRTTISSLVVACCCWFFFVGMFVNWSRVATDHSLMRDNGILFKTYSKIVSYVSPAFNIDLSFRRIGFGWNGFFISLYFICGCVVGVGILVFFYFFGGNRWNILCAGNSALYLFRFLFIYFVCGCLCVFLLPLKLCTSYMSSPLFSVPRLSNRIDIRMHCHGKSGRFDLTETKYVDH